MVDSSATLLARAAEGDQSAFAAFVRREQGAVMRYARALTRSPEAAEDVLQEAFLAAYEAMATFRGASSVRTWLLTITRHAAFRLGRKRAGEPNHFDDLQVLGQRAGWGDPETPEGYAIRREERESLRAALARLSEADREVITLRDLEGLSTREAAAIMDLTEAGVRTRLHRARLKFIARLRSRGAGDAA